MIEPNADGTVGDQQVRVWLGQHQGQFTLRTVSSDYYASNIEKQKSFIRWLTPMIKLEQLNSLTLIDQESESSLSFRLWLCDYDLRGMSVNLWVRGDTIYPTENSVANLRTFVRWLTPILHIDTRPDVPKLITPTVAFYNLARDAGFTVCEPSKADRWAPYLAVGGAQELHHVTEQLKQLLKLYTHLSEDEKKYIFRAI